MVLVEFQIYFLFLILHFLLFRWINLKKSFVYIQKRYLVRAVVHRGHLSLLFAIFFLIPLWLSSFFSATIWYGWLSGVYLCEWRAPFNVNTCRKEPRNVHFSMDPWNQKQKLYSLSSLKFKKFFWWLLLLLPSDNGFSNFAISTENKWNEWMTLSVVVRCAVSLICQKTMGWRKSGRAQELDGHAMDIASVLKAVGNYGGYSVPVDI